MLLGAVLVVAACGRGSDRITEAEANRGRARPTTTTADPDGFVGEGDAEDTTTTTPSDASSGTTGAPTTGTSARAGTGTTSRAATGATGATTTAPVRNVRAPYGLSVDGNRIVDAAGRPLRLRGVNRSGGEFSCRFTEHDGLFDGPVDDPSVGAMTGWRVNAVRLPLNEHCWLGLPTVPQASRGEPYRRAVVDYVDRLHRHGLVVILNLHDNAPGSYWPEAFTTYPDADHAPGFWSSVAATFRNDPDPILFDLFNEPHPRDSGPGTAAEWACWRDGCTARSEVHTAEGRTTETTFRTAGMQHLVDAVRSTGATQPLVLDGLRWANDVGGWLAHRPHDPQGALVAGFHVYDDNECVTSGCWSNEVGRLAQTVPVLATEVGSYDCRPEFTAGFLRWADAAGVGWLGWTWNAAEGRVEADDDWSCKGGPSLVEDWRGTPTPFGVAIRDHLRTSQ